jgi:hypothetical protein
MGRSGYSEDCDLGDKSMYLYRGAVERAIRGARGQAFLKELLEALDAMPEKRLIPDSLRAPQTGEVCTLGAIGAYRCLDMSGVEDSEPEGVADLFGIAQAMAREIMYENDEGGASYWGHENPEARWKRMRAWVSENIQSD